jgi:acyl-CoA synthetase (AMP-forming)/AMP-acid ligase II
MSAANWLSHKPFPPLHTAAWSRSVTEAALESATLVELLQARASLQPERCAFSFLDDGSSPESQLTYVELDRRARAIAAQLQSVATCGARALLLYPPGLEFIAAFFGCLYAGVAAIPMYPPHVARLHSILPRIQAIATQAQATLALTTTAIETVAQPLLQQTPALANVHWLATDSLCQENCIDSLAEQWRVPAISGDSLAFVQYTSGSTAAPKGVMVSHGNLLHNLGLIHRAFEHTPDSRGVIWLPPYHDMGLIGGVFQPLYGGFPVTLMSPASFLMRPLRWLQTISRTGATTSGGPNFAYDLCVRKTSPEQRATLDLSRWNVAFTGAEPIRHETLERFATAFEACGFRREAFYPCYGLAEATLFVTGSLKSKSPLICHVEEHALQHNRVVALEASHAATIKQKNVRSLIGCGHAATHQEVCIVDPVSRTRCAPDAVGEIWIKGHSVAGGYLHRPDETEQVFGAHLSDTDEGPYLRSGDLGFFHGGELFVTGRIKDLIIIGGRNHYPEDIEHTVEQNHPAIRPNCCSAFSVDVDGEERLIILAEVERRYLVEAQQLSRSTRDETSTQGAITGGASRLASEAEALLQVIRQAVTRHHDLRVHTLLLLKPGSLPKTSSGKIQRHLCRTLFLNGALNALNTAEE